MKPNGRKTRDSLPVSGDEVLQLQQSLFTVFNHLISVQMLHQTRQDPTHTHTQYEQNWSNVTINQHSGKFMAERVCSELLLQCHLQCLKQQQRLCYETQMQNVSNINKATICSICFLPTERLSSWRSGPNISNTSTHMGSPFRMCLQAVWMTDSQASFRARSMR